MSGEAPEDRASGPARSQRGASASRGLEGRRLDYVAGAPLLVVVLVGVMLLLVIAAGVWLLFRWLDRGSGRSVAREARRLDRQLARGELTIDEYRARMRELEERST